jgi:hypothetical protein
VITAAAAAVCAAAARADAPTLVVNQGIGAAKMGESHLQVALDYGSFCDKGCAGRVSVGRYGMTTVDYRVPGGHLVLAFRFNRIALIQTTSPRYRTATGVGVGARLPTAKSTWNGFKAGRCKDGSTVWTQAGKAVVTRLHAVSGVVKTVEMRVLSLPQPAC